MNIPITLQVKDLPELEKSIALELKVQDEAEKIKKLKEILDENTAGNDRKASS